MAEPSLRVNQKGKLKSSLEDSRFTLNPARKISSVFSAINIEMEENMVFISPFTFISSSDSMSPEVNLKIPVSGNGEQDIICGKEEDDTAVIGFSLRFSVEATSADEFCKIMVEAKFTATEIPPEMLNLDALYSADPAAMGTVKCNFPSRKAMIVNLCVDQN